MELYTITATPVKSEASDENNALLIMGYPTVVAKVLARHGIDGFTMYQVNGYWQGVAEKSFKIEIATDGGLTGVARICAELRDMYNQDAVMLTHPNNEVEFI